jgi:A/G-specific adenine glycosylase
MIAAKELPNMRRALLAWHRRHGLPAPWRESRDPYQALVAATMAQQTQMSRVQPKYEEFIAAYPAVESLASASTADVLRAWSGLGYNLRALRLHRAAQLVVGRGGFPRTAEELARIEGIGPCTAAVVSSFAFGEAAPAIDTNVRRIVSRVAFGDVDARTAERALAKAAATLVSRRAPGRWNQAMMDFGALVCTARAPKCGTCPLATWCRARPRIARANGARRVAEPRVAYRAKAAYAGSRRYYRGRIVQALRELPAGASMTPAALLTALTPSPSPGGTGEPAGAASTAIDQALLRELLEALRRDGLVCIERGRVRL